MIKKLYTNVIIILYYPKKDEFFIQFFKQVSYKIHNYNLKIRHLSPQMVTITRIESYHSFD